KRNVKCQFCGGTRRPGNGGNAAAIFSRAWSVRGTAMNSLSTVSEPAIPRISVRSLSRPGAWWRMSGRILGRTPRDENPVGYGGPEPLHDVRHSPRFTGGLPRGYPEPKPQTAVARTDQVKDLCTP